MSSKNVKGEVEEDGKAQSAVVGTSAKDTTTLYDASSAIMRPLSVTLSHSTSPGKDLPPRPAPPASALPHQHVHRHEDQLPHSGVLTGRVSRHKLPVRPPRRMQLTTQCDISHIPGTLLTEARLPVHSRGPNNKAHLTFDDTRRVTDPCMHCQDADKAVTHFTEECPRLNSKERRRARLHRRAIARDTATS